MKLKAIVSKISTSTDGGLKITFDVAENEVEIAKELLSMRDKVLSLEIEQAG